MNQRDSQILGLIHSVLSLSETSTQSDDSNDEPPTHAIANVSQQRDNTQLETLRLLKEIKFNLIESRCKSSQQNEGSSNE